MDEHQNLRAGSPGLIKDLGPKKKACLTRSSVLASPATLKALGLTVPAAKVGFGFILLSMSFDL